jgi:hypothetical protein
MGACESDEPEYHDTLMVSRYDCLDQCVECRRIPASSNRGQSRIDSLRLVNAHHEFNFRTVDFLFHGLHTGYYRLRNQRADPSTPSSEVSRTVNFNESSVNESLSISIDPALGAMMRLRVSRNSIPDVGIGNLEDE